MSLGGAPNWMIPLTSGIPQPGQETQQVQTHIQTSSLDLQQPKTRVRAERTTGLKVLLNPRGSQCGQELTWGPSKRAGEAREYGHWNKHMSWISPCCRPAPADSRGYPNPSEMQTKSPKSCHHNPTPVTRTSNTL